jgi:hypothetical protein
VSVYRDADGSDCTADGASSRFEEFTIVEVMRDGVLDTVPRDWQVFTPTHRAPAARLVFRSMMGGLWHLEPVVAEDTQPWLMFGGNYAATTDSRLHEVVGHKVGALAIHDRKEF